MNLRKKTALLLSLIMVFIGVLSHIPVGADTQVQDIVLVLDESGSMSGEPMTGLKEAAKQFCEIVLENNNDNRVAIVSFSGGAYTEGFTDDISALVDEIDRLYASGGTNLHGGLAEAEGLLLAESRQDAVTSIVVMADGFPNSGESKQEGHYQADQSSIYHYANAVYDYAVGLHPVRQVYTVSFLHELTGENRAFCEQLLKDIQNAGYYSAENVDELLKVFSQIAQVILQPVELSLSSAEKKVTDSENTYEITATIRNANQQQVENVIAQLNVPEGMGLEEGELPSKSLGTITGNGYTTAVWQVRVPTEKYPDDRSLTYEVTVTSDNTVGLSQVETIFVKGHQAVDHRITYQNDTWSFINSPDFFQDTYYMSDEMWQAFSSKLSPSKKAEIETEHLNGEWGGSCYGMSSIVVLNKLHMYQPNMWDKDASTLSEMENRNNTDTESSINFYQFQQYLKPAETAMKETQVMTLQEQLQLLKEKAGNTSKGGNPVFLVLFWGKKNEEGKIVTTGHALVAYDVESLSKPYKYKGVKYNTKIYLYDPNSTKFSDKRCLYITEDETMWCVPHYKIVGTEEKTTKGVGDGIIGLITDRLEIIDTINVGDTVSNYKAVVRAKSLTDFLLENQDSGKTIQVSGETAGKVDGANIYYTGAGYVEGGEGRASLCVELEDETAFYSLDAGDEAKPLDVSISYEDMYYSAQADAGKNMSFQRNSGMNLGEVEGDFHLQMTFDNVVAQLPWTTVSAFGNGTSDIGVKKTEEGLLVDGSALVNVTIWAEEGDKEATYALHTTSQKVLLQTENDAFSAYLDLDGDGNYTDAYTRLESISLEKDFYEIQVNEKVNIDAQFVPENHVEYIKWESSDPSVAKVDDQGNVSGLKKGTVTITASNYEGDVAQQCKVTVGGGNGWSFGSRGNNGGFAALILVVLAMLLVIGVIVVIGIAGANKGATKKYTGNPNHSQEQWAKENIYELFEEGENKEVTSTPNLYGASHFTGRITGLSGPYKGASIPLTEGEELVIGKDPQGAQVVIDASYTKVSRKHCGIKYSPMDDSYYVMDYSMNGTYLAGGVALPKGSYTKVKPGTTIYLYSQSIMFRLENH